MKGFKKAIAVLMAVCMLVGMPLSVNVGAAEQLHVENAYLGAKGTADENYLFIKFSEKANLQTRANENLLGVSVFDAAGNQKARAVIDTPSDTANLPGSSDANGLYKVRLKVPSNWGSYTSIATWLEDKFINAAGDLKLVCYISDPINNTAVVDGSIPIFKGATTGTFLRNDTPGFVYGSTGKEATKFDMTSQYDRTPLTLQSLTRVNLLDFTMKFSEPVTVTGGSNFGVCVVKDGSMVSSKNLVVGSWRGKTAGSTYTDTWQLGFHHNDYHMGLNTSIASFIAKEYTPELQAAGAKVCYYITDTAANKKDGLIDSVYTQSGKKLKNNATITGTNSKEAYFIPLDTQSVFFEPKAYLAAKDRIYVQIDGQYSSGWTGQTYLAAFDATGAILNEWKLTLCSNFKKGSTTRNVAFYFGENSTTDYETVVAYCDANYTNGYQLKLIVKDTNTANNALGNGVVDSLIHYNITKNVPDAVLRAYSTTATADIGVIPFGEAVTVDKVDVYGGDKVIITFSHDIDMDKLMAGIAKDKNGNDFFLGISAKGVDNLVGYDEAKGHVVAGGWCDQASILDLRPYAGSRNMVIGRLDAADYAAMMTNFENLKKTYPNEGLEYAIRLRIEMDNAYDSSTGVLPMNYNIVSLTEGVASPTLTPNSGRCCWTDVNLISVDENDVLINGEIKDLAQINSVESGEAVLLADTAVEGVDVLNVKPDVTLDLNGKTLTLADDVSLYVTGVVADSTDGNGLIIINRDQAENPFQLRGDNAQMPLFDTQRGGYRLFKKTFTTPGYRQGTADDPNNTNVMRYGIHLHFDNAKAFDLLAMAGAELVLTANIYTDDRQVNIPYTFTGDILKEYAKQCKEAADETARAAKTVVLKITGMDELAGKTLRVDAALLAMNATQMGYVQIVK